MFISISSPLPVRLQFGCFILKPNMLDMRTNTWTKKKTVCQKYFALAVCRCAPNAFKNFKGALHTKSWICVQPSCRLRQSPFNLSLLQRCYRIFKLLAFRAIFFRYQLRNLHPLILYLNQDSVARIEQFCVLNLIGCRGGTDWRLGT